MMYVNVINIVSNIVSSYLNGKTSDIIMNWRGVENYLNYEPKIFTIISDSYNIEKYSSNI